MTISNKKNDPSDLLLTERGGRWLNQFDPCDRETAEKIISSLTLVSASEFSQALRYSFEKQAGQMSGSIAFYAIREINKYQPYFNKNGKAISLSRGKHHGSEAIVANLITNYCKNSTNTKILLNHPDIEDLRKEKCGNIILVDDLIGSGKRTTDFLNAFLQDSTIRSWCSSQYITFYIIAYSASEIGLDKLRKHTTKPKIKYNLSCPIFNDINPNEDNQNNGEEIKKICNQYGNISPRKEPLGYGSLMAAIVFQHGCPNNVPAILWNKGTEKNKWVPLFPNRSINPPEEIIFSSGIIRRNPKKILLEIGQKEIAISINDKRINEQEKESIIILALIDKGYDKENILSYATGLNQEKIKCILQKFIKNKIIKYNKSKGKKELTAKGKKESIAIKKYMKKTKLNLPKEGKDYYYPKSLRKAIYG